MANASPSVTSIFTDIANAIREKTGRSDSIVADDFPFALASIPDNSVLLSILDKSIETLPSSYLEGTTSIHRYCFSSCTKLASISLPEGITSIGDSAFAWCHNLSLSSLPKSLTSIGTYAFNNCIKISNIELPERITDIKQGAFASCSLTTITFKGTPTNIASIFIDCRRLTTINVPWSEGEVAGAPWGATNATINYNYKGLD